MTEVIVEAGLTLIAEAELPVKLAEADPSAAGPKRTDAVAPCAISNTPQKLAALELGRSIVKIGETWWILLMAAETKEKRADERPIEDEISRSLGQVPQSLIGRSSVVALQRRVDLAWD